MTKEERVDLIKKVYSKTEYPKVIDTKFSELGVTSLTNEIDNTFTVADFFEKYNELFYDIPSYKKALDQNQLPSFRGMRLNEDDKIRQHATQQIRSYFKIDYKNFKDQFGIDVKEYFKDEIDFMKDMHDDGLVEFTDEGIFLTDIGRDFTQNIMNVFDKYDPPNKSYTERLETIKKAKKSQAAIQEKI